MTGPERPRPEGDAPVGLAGELPPGFAEALIASSVEGMLAVDREERVILWNPAMERLTGLPAEATLGRAVEEVFARIGDAGEAERFRRALAGEAVPASRRSFRHAGTRVEGAFEAHCAPLRGAAGQVQGALAVVRDASERQRLEAQLLQAQKMEAVGRLAGGIAHDFNNLLTAILGYCELALLREVDAETSSDLWEIRRAAERAGDLTRQLLAFSRKQVVQPRVLDPNAEIRELEPMLRRLIGEDVQLAILLDPDVGTTRADPGQLQQVLVNLLVNARDAMPTGGRVGIETRNVELDEEYARVHPGARAGRYVMLAVSDTGGGMAPEVRSRIFEPFFTTKERGKGTGLGLAMVYGAVKQSEGYIWVYSEQGRGTTFKIYLPRIDQPADERQRSGSPAEEPLGGTETVLVAEDEHVVRALLVRLLRVRGYRVLEAESGGTALAAAESEGHIDLLITDVIMTDMSGRELADRLAALRPGLRVLYISGYTDESIAHHGVLAPGVRLLEKPFTADALARAVREVLGGKAEQ